MASIPAADAAVAVPPSAVCQRMHERKEDCQIVTFGPFHDANSARDRPAIVVQALLELVAALVARF